MQVVPASLFVLIQHDHIIATATEADSVATPFLRKTCGCAARPHRAIVADAVPFVLGNIDILYARVAGSVMHGCGAPFAVLKRARGVRPLRAFASYTGHVGVRVIVGTAGTSFATEASEVETGSEMFAEPPLSVSVTLSRGMFAERAVS